ncbi:condensation domain-containing protein [Nocardia callitridis]|uniref:Condensation domain-containing protein n=1 Tax=Nocardia callitridis TaxID=648753 RepID=A0ABP9K7K1_9NOCA
MVSFGLIDEWEPVPGNLVSWVASPESVSRAEGAPAHPARPSHQQEQYLRAADRNSATEFRFSGLCVVTAEIPDVLDRAAMTRAINAFLLRHDTFRTWFAIERDGTVRRHLVPEQDVEFVSVEQGEIDNAEAIREHVQKTTPGPFQWDCFTFGAIEHHGSTTVYLAVDHLHTDGVAQYLSCYELAHLYLREGGQDAGALITPGSYIEYCERERAYSDQLTLNSPGVRKWLQLVRANDGELPSFALDLGKSNEGYTRSAHRTIPLCDEDEAQRFEQVCRDSGAEFTGGIFAVSALAERQLVDNDYFFTITPISTRGSIAEIASVGWYVALIPVAFPIGSSASFARMAASAQRAYSNGLELTQVSFHRVLELVPADDTGISVRPGWSNPMISYVDARDFAGNEYFDVAQGGVYANRATTEQVLIWINRLPSGTTLSVIYPDTPGAHESVERYITTVKSVFLEVTKTVVAR